MSREKLVDMLRKAIAAFRKTTESGLALARAATRIPPTTGLYVCTARH